MTKPSIAADARRLARKTHRGIKQRTRFLQMCVMCGEAFSSPPRSGRLRVTCSRECWDESNRRRRAAYWAGSADRRAASVATTKAWRAANPERAREMSSRQAKQWCLDNPERAKEMQAAACLRRRARLSDALVHDVSPAVVWEFNPAGPGCCNYCRVELSFDDRKSWHIDHVMPLSRGGLHELQNLVIACAPCNLNKASRTLDEWRAA